MTTVNDFVDILRIIREQPEWGDALRSALLSKELLEMPQTLAEFVKATDQRLAALESDVAELKAGQARLEEGQARLEERQTRLEGDVGNLKADVGNLKADVGNLKSDVGNLKGDVGNLKGNAYELKVGNNILSIMGQHTDIVPIRVLKGSRAPNDMAFLNPVYEARRKGVITEEERRNAFAVDIVVEGRAAGDDSTVYIVVEVSITIADNDVSRASERAGIVQKATGKQALPVVVGAYADQPRRQLATEQNVTVIAYGE